MNTILFECVCACMCISVFVGVCAGACACVSACVWWSEVDLACLPSSRSTIQLEAGSLI